MKNSFQAYFDGVISNSSVCTSAEVVITDLNENFVKAFACSYDGIQEPKLVEFMALKLLLHAIQDLFFQSISILSDAQNVILAALGEADCLAISSSILCNVKRLLLDVLSGHLLDSTIT